MCGLALFIMVLIQIVLGTIAHFFKHRSLEKGSVGGRSPLRLLHVIMGLAIVALGWVTVYEGIWVEWPLFTSGPANKGYKIGYAVIVGVASALYLGGLILLPRQLRAEKEERDVSGQGTPNEKRRKGMGGGGASRTGDGQGSVDIPLTARNGDENMGA